MTQIGPVTSPEAEHAALESVLPWYANGTLDAGESERVRRHLETCERCAQTLGEWRNIEAGVVELDAPWTPPTGHFERMMADLEAAPAAPHEPANLAAREPAGVLSRLRSWLGEAGWLSGWQLTPVYARWALAGQTALVLMLAVVLLARAPAPNEPDFVTLTAAPAGADASDLQSTKGVQIVFAEDLRQAQLADLLNGAGAQIVSGPSRLGVYKITLSRPDRLEDVLAELRGHAGVELAEPVDLLLVKPNSD